jgi:hypothetical protein
MHNNNNDRVASVYRRVCLRSGMEYTDMVPSLDVENNVCASSDSVTDATPSR